MLIDRSTNKNKCIAAINLVSDNIVIKIKRYFIGARLSQIAFILIFLFLLFHFFMNHFFNGIPQKLLSNVSPSDESYKLRDLKHINDLNRIKKSVSIELRELEKKRNQIQDEIATHQEKLNSFEKTVKNAQSELEVLKRQIVQLKNEQREAEKPKMVPPARLLASEADDVILTSPSKYNKCRMQNCFDYSRCSLVSQFPVYVYPPDSTSPFQVTPYIFGATRSVLSSNSYITMNPHSACVYFVIVGEVESSGGADSKPDGLVISDWLKSLSYWHGDGRNHVLLYLSRKSATQNPLLGVDTGRSIIAQSNFASSQFRSGFDVVMPTLISQNTNHKHDVSEQEVDRAEQDVWMDERKESWFDDSIPVQVPALRQYFIFFQGHYDLPDSNTFNYEESPDTKSSVENFHDIFVKTLKKLMQSTLHGKNLIEMKCLEDRLVTTGFNGEWGLCGSFTTRSLQLSHSTFTLVPAPDNYNSLVSTSIFVTRLAEGLRSGAVPVVIGNHGILPFSEFIEWEKAVIIIPQARITEIHFLLLNQPHSEILDLRRHGKFIFDTYFSSAKVILDAVMALIRSRLQIPPLPVEDKKSEVYEHESYKIVNHEVSPGDAQSEFGLPTPDGALDSPRFIRNFTMVTMDTRKSWNSIPGPFQLFPHHPNDRLLPSDAQFIGSTDGFRPTGQGQGGTGRVFQESLGGNSPREQFTMVMLTYERDDVLMQAIQRLWGLPYLNKVVVVWNSPSPPKEDLVWPKIEAEVVVIRPKKNSLNNRFIPWDEIKTEAVLSIDDDAHLRHDEILFGFRVWRENRDRIVGFPGRFHAWDSKYGSWNYDSNHTCELSMVLTGAAFLHKYYLHLYTDWMPSVVRDIVDEYMNCEDIAINFLVSHVTRKPPVKVTSRWTFHCPGCPVALSQSQEHFEERHKCLNKFVKIFGYMPLMYTQYRVDSVLFKTRLPHDKQKCFKFI